MKNWSVYLQRGKEHLARHAPDKALDDLETALELCPVESTKSLSKVLFYLGVALTKIGCSNSALKCWLTSQKLHKTSYATKMIKRFSNEYGMIKQQTERLDDWKAFYSIQLAKYLRTKKNNDFTNAAEKDMIDDLIRDYWEKLNATDLLESKTHEEKLGLFKRVKIVFPFVVDRIAENAAAREGSGFHDVIPVNFREKQSLTPSDRCFCGSGLSFGMCCGRTPGEDEVQCGIF
jgi:uncharacterized protein YchJ